MEASDLGLIVVCPYQPPITFDLTSCLVVAPGFNYGKYGYCFVHNQRYDFIARDDHQYIASIRNGYRFKHGVSYAVPRIAALVSLILERFPNINTPEVVNILSESATCTLSTEEEENELFNQENTMKRLMNQKASHLVIPKDVISLAKEAILYGIKSLGDRKEIDSGTFFLQPSSTFNS